MNPLNLQRIDEGKNMARFYNLAIEPTLFGGSSLVREWGRMGTSGRRRIDLYEQAIEAEAARSKLAHKKHRRGYVQAGQ